MRDTLLSQVPPRFPLTAGAGQASPGRTLAENAMYPFLRMAKEILSARRATPLAITDTHVSHHICWPWDLDLWWELNNGRTLTLFDLGRFPMAIRMGVTGMMRDNRWGLTVAGSAVQYRRRVRAFDRVEMRSRCIGWDARFLYVEQALFRGDVCTSHVVLRKAITSSKGIVPTAEVMAALGQSMQSPALPEWVNQWIAAESKRPYPPQI